MLLCLAGAYLRFLFVGLPFKSLVCIVAGLGRLWFCFVAGSPTLSIKILDYPKKNTMLID